MEEVFAKFAQHVEHTPDKVALTQGQRSLTFVMLDRIVDEYAHFLTAATMEPGKVVGWIGPDGLDRVIFIIATQKAGLCYAAPDLKNPPEAIRRMFEIADTHEIVAHSAFEKQARALGFDEVLIAPDSSQICSAGQKFSFVATDPEGPSNLRYTSGSTGIPKCVVHRRCAQQYFDEVTVHCTQLTANDTILWPGQLWPSIIFAAMIAGARIHCFETQTLGISELAEEIRREKVSVMMVFVALYRQIAATGLRFPDLRCVSLSGELLSTSDVEHFEQMCKPGSLLVNNFGLSEFPLFIQYVHQHGAPVVSETLPLGKAFYPETAKLLDKAGREVAHGDVGEIVIESEYVPHGYLKNPQLSSRVFDKTGNGKWRFHTGDLAFRDLNDVYHPMGRKDEQVKIRGYNVRPPDIESLLNARSDVSEVAVISVQDLRKSNRLA